MQKAIAYTMTFQGFLSSLAGSQLVYSCAYFAILSMTAWLRRRPIKVGIHLCRSFRPSQVSVMDVGCGGGIGPATRRGIMWVSVYGHHLEFKAQLGPRPRKNAQGRAVALLNCSSRNFRDLPGGKTSTRSFRSVMFEHVGFMRIWRPIFQGACMNQVKAGRL